MYNPIRKTKEGYEYQEFIYCGCGCGLTKSKYDTHGRIGKYIHRHTLKGERSPFYKNGEYIDRKGYVRIRKPDHPKVCSDGYIAKHRLVYEEYYNCCLLPWTDIHHINIHNLSKEENKRDNSIENLQVIMHSEHSILTCKERWNKIH